MNTADKSTSQIDLYNALLLVAENDGRAHADNHDAFTAVRRAYMQRRRLLLDGLAVDFAQIREELTAELANDWK